MPRTPRIITELDLESRANDADNGAARAALAERWEWETRDCLVLRRRYGFTDNTMNRGVNRLGTVDALSPNSPDLLRPQHATELSAVMAQVCR